MASALSPTCGSEPTERAPGIDEAEYKTASCAWCVPHGVMDTGGGMPLEIVVAASPEDVEDANYYLEHVKARRDEPTLSAEEVKQELDKDGLL